MASGLRDVLEYMTRLPCIIAAILMKSDGAIVEASISDAIELDTTKGSAADMLQGWDCVGSTMGFGKPKALLIERRGGPLSVMPVAGDIALVALGNPSCSAGRMRREMHRAANALHDIARGGNGERSDFRAIIGMVPADGGGHDAWEAVERKPSLR